MLLIWDGMNACAFDDVVTYIWKMKISWMLYLDL